MRREVGFGRGIECYWGINCLLRELRGSLQFVLTRICEDLRSLAGTPLGDKVGSAPSRRGGHVGVMTYIPVRYQGGPICRAVPFTVHMLTVVGPQLSIIREDQPASERHKFQ